MTATLLRSAIRRARQAGMTYEHVWRVVGEEFGAVYRESAIDGWTPVVKEAPKGKGKRCK